jgi:hypothetical protein
MGRCLLIAEYFISVKHKNSENDKKSEDKIYPIYIATSHFESMEGPSKRMRKSQMDDTFGIIF